MTASMGSPHGPRTIKASEFKAICLRLMDDVAENGGEIVITKNGRPSPSWSPCREKPRTLFGIDRGRLDSRGRCCPSGWRVGSPHGFRPGAQPVILLASHVVL